jgi:hypothetical protein
LAAAWRRRLTPTTDVKSASRIAAIVTSFSVSGHRESSRLTPLRRAIYAHWCATRPRHASQRAPVLSSAFARACKRPARRFREKLGGLAWKTTAPIRSGIPEVA